MIMEKTEDLNNRIEWIDIAKCIGILLVIIGHTVYYNVYGSGLRGIIFSFHMPLFFILSSITFKNSKDGNQFINKIQRGYKKLIIPALTAYIIYILIDIYKQHALLFNLNFWKEKLYTFIFASGVKVSFNGNDVIPMGMLWFFFVLFTGRIIFDYLHLVFEENQLFIVCCIISFIGIMLGKIQWLPFSLDITLAVIPFFYIGYKLKKYKVTVKPFRKMILWAQVFIMTLAITFPDYKDWTYMELAMRRYTLFPICYITSVAGTLFVCEISVLLYMYLKKIIKPICYLGRNSLYIFFIHYYDFLWRKIWTIEGHQFYSAFIRVVIDICVFLCAAILVNLVKKLTRITKIYFIQKSKFHVIQDKY